ncbi:MAG: hypothetical protein M4579_005567 [Chaenotheca gracillima]|nr:MAG: hypothetical protein M4579_005567 [Chaenotheca gracillima]
MAPQHGKRPRESGKPPQKVPVKELALTPRPDWHLEELPKLPDPRKDLSNIPKELIQSVQEHARSLLQSENENYSSSHMSASSSHRFLSTIMSSGTLSDKISALTLVIQESPLHTMKAFENLLGLARKRSRGQAVTALGALKDLLGQGVVLPSDRKLKSFGSQPGLLGVLQARKHTNWTPGQILHPELKDAHLISWAFEDWLKTTYFEVLKILESWCNDEVEFARARAVGYVFELLQEKPEQEANLLRLLVNKLGDREKKIASKTSYLLLQLQGTHPMMKPIIISAIESELLFRPGQSSHARYYAMITLNQVTLSAKEEAVAGKLLDLYFTLFISLLKQQQGNKPAADEPPKPILNKKGQVQGGGGKAGKKATKKAREETTVKSADEELNEKMISAVLTGVNRAFPFANADDITFQNHLDTLFRITHSANFNTSIQALMLIQQISTTKHLATDRFYRTLYESLFDPRLLTSSKQTLYLNLLYRALNADLNAKRVNAFVKRMLQIITLHQPAFACGILYLIKHLEETFPRLRGSFEHPEEFDEDEEENFRDVPEDDNDVPKTAETAPRAATAPNLRTNSRSYDGRKRDPEHSNADKSCLWDICPLLSHFHPSVSLFASKLLSNEVMPPKPDLSLHTLIHFLDRFVYRNSKANQNSRGVSIMQPLSGGGSEAMLMANRDGSRAKAPLNTENFWSRKAEDISADEVFFHKYFNEVGRGGANAAKRKRDKQADKEDVSEEDEGKEDEIWKALVDSRPEIEGSDEGESDLEMDDLSSDEDGFPEIDDDESDEEAADEEDDIDMGGELDGVDGLPSDDDDNGSADLEATFQKELEMAEPEKVEEEPTKEPKNKRRKMKNLPTFASAEDYAEMLAGEEQD